MRWSSGKARAHIRSRLVARGALSRSLSRALGRSRLAADGAGWKLGPAVGEQEDGVSSKRAHAEQNSSRLQVYNLQWIWMQGGLWVARPGLFTGQGVARVVWRSSGAS